MNIQPSTIAKAQQLINSNGAALLYLWMLADGDSSYTQRQIIQKYGVKKRSLRDLLYRLIDMGLVVRKYNHGYQPLYYPQKKDNHIANEPILTD